MWSLLAEIGKWLHPVVYVIGLGIAVWAFLRCRKPGYLVLGIYFALIVFWLLAGVAIWETVLARQPQDMSGETRQKIELADRQATDQVLKEQGYQPAPATTHLYFPLGPIVLVTGIWFLARREKPVSS